MHNFKEKIIKVFKKNLFQSIAVFVVFAAFFLFFFLRNHYFVPVDLTITGNFPNNIDAILSWDSGQGFNRNEVLPIKLESESTSKVISLPQLGLKEIKISPKDSTNQLEINSFEIKYSDKEEKLSFEKSQENTYIAKINSNNFRKIRPLLISIQIILSLVLAWIFYEIISLKKRFKKKNWVETFKYIFLEEKHWAFWLMFLVSVATFSFWLLGQWPGAVSPDTFYQLYQTKTLVLEDAHPYIHTLYMLSLMQFYDSFGTIAIFQILATAALGSYIFYFVFKNGLKWYLVLPFYLGFIFSIPIGLFNVVIWKDVPFSILVAFWGFYLFYLGYQKSRGIEINFGLKKIIILSCLFILMTLIRHNGPLYLIVLPLIILWGNLMPRKVVIKFVLFSIVLFIILNYLVPYTLNITKWSSNITSLAWKVNPMASLILAPSYITDDPVYDKKIIEKIMTYDYMKKNYNPNYGGNLIVGTQFEKLNPEDITAFNHLFYIRMIENLPAFLSERTRLFMALLSCRTVTWTNEFFFDFYKSYVYFWGSGTTLYMQYHPVEKLSNFQLNIVQEMEKIKPVVFDLIYPTLFLLIILALYKWLPISSRANFLLVSQLPVWFIFVIAPDFRYLYSIYLYYFFAFPLLILEIIHNRSKNPHSLINNKWLYSFLIIFLVVAFLIPISAVIASYFLVNPYIKPYINI